MHICPLIILLSYSSYLNLLELVYLVFVQYFVLKHSKDVYFLCVNGSFFSVLGRSVSACCILEASQSPVAVASYVPAQPTYCSQLAYYVLTVLCAVCHVADGAP